MPRGATNPDTSEAFTFDPEVVYSVVIRAVGKNEDKKIGT